MQIAHLRSLLAIQKTGSLSAAAAAVHLSHSAVSIQMRQLEQTLGAEVVVKGRRPTLLTPFGEQVAERARAVIGQIDELKSLAGQDQTGGKVALGFVPTTLQTLLPVVLRRLREDFPDMAVSVVSGLSNQLAQSIDTGDLDFAFLSGPITKHPTMRVQEIGTEPLFLVTSPDKAGKARVADIIRQNPYIAFSRNTWLGAQIAAHLVHLGLNIDPAIELDSIDAIENLVTRDFGVSIVPQRLMAPPLNRNLRCVPLKAPAPVRQLVLATARHNQRQSVQATLASIADD